MDSKKTTKNDAADIKATVKDILNADKTETAVKKGAAATAKKPAAKKTAAAATKKAATEEKKAAAPAAEKKAAPAAEKKTATAKKPAAKKAAKDSATKVVVQVWGNDIDVADITARAEDAYKANGKKKSLKELYIKPEEGKAYYVADDDSGSVDLW